jgi:DNA modification methylase
MKNKKNKETTETSAFGTRGRISHDASRFYNSRLYQGLDAQETDTGPEQAVPGDALDRIFCKTSEKMDDLPDNCIHLMVTSPPYNASKEYDEDLGLEEYLSLLDQVWQETYRVLAPGGRACINIANLGRRPYIPLHAYIIDSMLTIGFLMRGEIIWDKGSSASSSTAWGSWMSASNPVLRDVHEYILVFSKGNFRRKKNLKENSIERDDFLEWTKSVWHFPAVSARQIGHPAPFPEELPRRLIELYTYREDVVLDPFMGSGTTALAAVNTQRYYVGYEIDENYTALARERVAALRQ